MPAPLPSPRQSPVAPASCGQTAPDTPSAIWWPGHQAVTLSSQEIIFSQGMWPVVKGPEQLEVTGGKPSLL